MIDGVEFEAPEYRSDATFRTARFRFYGTAHDGYRIERDGVRWLELGPGYHPLRTIACGVCSTDLDRHLLPFPLPQVTGHELVAVDEAGRRFVVEINASPYARGLASPCPDCDDGLERHCPRRLVLGIHDLPGGFGPWVLAPRRAAIPIPDPVPTDVALLVEPFAAALHAVDRSDLRSGDVVGVLGPRKLGMLVIAALAARRREGVWAGAIVALPRRRELERCARRMGADDVQLVDPTGGAPANGTFDLVFDTTGTAVGFERALQLARREVHLKSTHGRPAGGLARSTALVVDELRIERYSEAGAAVAGDGSAPTIGWLSGAPVPGALAGRVVAGQDALALRAAFPPRVGGCIGGSMIAVVDDLSGADAAIRPSAGDESALVRPTGTILLRSANGGPLATAIHDRGLRLSSSRCGDFATALALLARDRELRVGLATLITHRFGAAQIAAAFETARSPTCVKVVIEHSAETTGAPES